MCKFELLGECIHGAACKFAHKSDELVPPPDFTRTRLCAEFQREGVCQLGAACTFAHGEGELRKNVMGNGGKKTRTKYHAASCGTNEALPLDATQFYGVDAASLVNMLEYVSAINQRLNDTSEQLKSLQLGLHNPQSTPHELPLSSVNPPNMHSQPYSCCKMSDGPHLGEAEGWSRQSTAVVSDDNGFSRQSTESVASWYSGYGTDQIVDASHLIVGDAGDAKIPDESGPETLVHDTALGSVPACGKIMYGHNEVSYRIANTFLEFGWREPHSAKRAVATMPELPIMA